MVRALVYVCVYFAVQKIGCIIPSYRRFLERFECYLRSRYDCPSRWNSKANGVLSPFPLVTLLIRNIVFSSKRSVVRSGAISALEGSVVDTLTKSRAERARAALLKPKKMTDLFSQGAQLRASVTSHSYCALYRKV